MKSGTVAILIMVAVGVAFGLLIAGLPTQVTLLALGGLAITACIFYRPVPVIMAMLFVVPFNFLWMGVGISLPEVIYGFIFIMLAVSWFLKKIIFIEKSKAVNWRVLVPVAAFLGAAALACVIGVLRGHAFRQWGSDLNALMYYGMCFFAADFIKDRKTLHTVFMVIFAAIVLGLLKGLYLVFANFPPNIDMLDVQHIRLSYASVLGLALFMISTAVSVSLTAWKERVPFILFSVFLAMMILASLARSLWIAGLFGLAVLFLASRQFEKNNLLKLACLGVLLTSLYFAVAMSFPAGNPLFNFANSIEKRYHSIFTAMDEPSIMTRQAEWNEAFRRAIRHPVLGNGLGTEITYFRYDQWFGAQTWITTRYVHNAYLSLFLNTGLFGLTLFLWMCYSLIRYGFSLSRKLINGLDKGFALGISCAMLALMVASMAGPLLISPMVTMWFGFFIGALTIIEKAAA